MRYGPKTERNVRCAGHTHDVRWLSVEDEIAVECSTEHRHYDAWSRRHERASNARAYGVPKQSAVEF